MLPLPHLSAVVFRTMFDVLDRKSNPYRTVSREELNLGRAALDRIALERLKAIVGYAYRNSRHYRKTFDDRGISPGDLRSLDDIGLFPVLTRDHLKNLDLVTTNGNRELWDKSATGGTTSSPISYYRDRDSSRRRQADTETIDSWYGRRLGDRVAYLWGAPQDIPKRTSLGARLRNAGYLRAVMLPSAPLDDTIMERHLGRLDAWRPVFLQAYPTPLYEFCRFLAERGRRLPYLKSASVTAEPMHDHQRVLIERTLGFRVFNWYGSRELGRVASECERHDGMHVNEPSMHVEVQADPTLPDGCGHLIVTDLWNRATPMIRYMTGDIARAVNGGCGCGRALKRIGGIEGRSVDTIILPRGRRVPGVSLTNRIVKDCDEIRELQVVQKTIDAFVLRYVRGPGFGSRSLATLSENLRRLLDHDVSVAFEELKELPVSASGKVRFVISEVGRGAGPPHGDVPGGLN